MIQEKLLEVLKHEGVVTIGTQGSNGPHLVNTWNSYISAEDDSFIIPVGGMNTTEANVAKNSQVKVNLGSREVEGFHGKGTGFSINGTAAFLKQGAEFDEVKKRFPWARAALEIKIDNATQTL